MEENKEMGRPSRMNPCGIPTPVFCYRTNLKSTNGYFLESERIEIDLVSNVGTTSSINHNKDAIVTYKVVYTK